MVTPFTKENTLDNAALRKEAAFQIENGSDALIVCGTTGEASTMSTHEQAEAIRMVVETANGCIPVIAGVGGNDTAKVTAACKTAKEIGADGVLAVTPYYNKATQEGLIAHFTAVAEASELPLILYNVPSRTNLSIQPGTLAALARHENIVGIKEASGDITLAAEMIQLCGDRIAIYAGNDDITLPILALGGAGVISVAANIIPKQMHRLCSLYFEGETAEACELYLSLMPLFKTLFVEVNPIPIKTAMNMLGHSMGPLRLPLTPIASENEAKLSDCLRQQGLLR